MEGTGIVVVIKIHPLAPLLAFYKTTVTIDGRSTRQGLGEHFFEMEPGTHMVSAAADYPGAVTHR